MSCSADSEDEEELAVDAFEEFWCEVRYYEDTDPVDSCGGSVGLVVEDFSVVEPENGAHRELEEGHEQNNSSKRGIVEGVVGGLGRFPEATRNNHVDNDHQEGEK